MQETRRHSNYSFEKAAIVHPTLIELHRRLKMLSGRVAESVNLNFRVPHASIFEGSGFSALASPRMKISGGFARSRNGVREEFATGESNPAPFANDAKSAAPANSTAQSQVDSMRRLVVTNRNETLHSCPSPRIAVAIPMIHSGRKPKQGGQFFFCQHVFFAAIVGNPAIAHQHNAFDLRYDVGRLVRDEHDSHAGLRELSHCFAQFALHRQIGLFDGSSKSSARGL